MTKNSSEVTLEGVTTWTYEQSEGGRPMPIMPLEEREAWHKLSNESCERALAPRERRLLKALHRKLQARGAAERD